jgi:hypothetical protein
MVVTMKYQNEIETDDGRREFLILTTTVPLLLVPIPSNAWFHALIFRFFARILFRQVVRKGVRRLVKPSVKKGRKRLNIKEVIKTNNQINDMVDVASYLSDQVWDRSKKNRSTLVVSNPTNKILSTQDILLTMEDTDKNSIDFQTKISSIDVPANSSVIVEMLFKNIDTSGMKRIYGVYNNETYSSGNILVSNNINNGLSIEELYRRKNRRYDGGMDEKLYLNPNIIL